LLNLIHGSFYGSEPACQAEAIWHVSSVMIEFGSVAFMTFVFADQVNHNVASVSNLVLGVHQAQAYPRELITNRRAFQLIACLWFSCILLVVLLSFISRIYLISAGTYCFFSFSSPAIVTLCVVLVIALGIMVYHHVQVMRQ